MIINKKRKAQQLIEFLLVAPFLIIILGLMTEYAYALNVNLTVQQGLRVTTANIYKKIKPNLSESDINNIVLSDLTQFLKDNNITTFYVGYSKSAISLKTLTVGKNTIYVASYRYYPAFTLPKVFFKLLPDYFDFVASASVPKAFLEGNSEYNTSTSDLNGIYGTDISSTDLYKGFKYGIMNEATGRTEIFFLVPTSDYASSAIGGDGYYICSWDGSEVSISGETLVVKQSDAKIYSCQNTTTCSLTAGINWGWIISTFDPKLITFVHDFSPTWLTPPGSFNIADSSVSGILKRSISMTDNGNSSIGNFDNFDISSYNGFFPTRNYKVIALGSRLFNYNESIDSTTMQAIETTIKGQSGLTKIYW